MRSNLKFTALGFLAACALGATLAATQSTNQPPSGRFTMVMSGNRAVILDTSNGKTWSHLYVDSEKGYPSNDFLWEKLSQQGALQAGNPKP